MSVSAPADPSGQPPAGATEPFPTTAFPRTWPLLVWLLVQLAALLLSATRVPLAAQYPRAAERLAVYLLLATQLFAAAALMPWLLHGWRQSLLAAASSWPLLGIAAMLSTVPPGRALAAGGYLTAWVATLALWNAAAPSRRVAFVFSAAASAVAAGGGLFWYLREDFGPAGAPTTPAAAWHHGPIPAAFSLASGGPVGDSGWPALLAMVALGGAVGFAMKKLIRRRPRQHAG